MSETVSPAERLELAWALWWPSALWDLLHSLVLEQLKRMHLELQHGGSVVSILSFLLFSTWVVRRTVRLDFSGFHLLVIRDDAADGTRKMTYGESLSVAWLIGWRSFLVLLPVIVPAIAVMAILGWYPQSWPQPLEWLWRLAILALNFFIHYTWIVKWALGKSYSGFSLRIDRSDRRNSVLDHVSHCLQS